MLVICLSSAFPDFLVGLGGILVRSLCVSLILHDVGTLPSSCVPFGAYCQDVEFYGLLQVRAPCRRSLRPKRWDLTLQAYDLYLCRLLLVGINT